MDMALSEYGRSGSLFGIHEPYRKTGGTCPDIFGEKLELPFGPAAGPHTQLAQNIIAAYASGARFFELKTVQTLDGEDLPVSKPCISAPDECYNVEWSTELYVPQAMDEYIKGWYALKLLSRELELGAGDGFVFNMSVGYDLEGIKSGKIDGFIEGLKNAEHTASWQTCRTWALENLSRFRRVDAEYIDGISPGICRSITLSTLHGCPPEEIERIAVYLLSEKNLSTFVKCNPTLLGYEYARKTLDGLGFDYLEFDDHHFKADLQFSDAVPMFQRLQKLADSLSLSFGVKLTNTFPVSVTESQLPGEEMYMSGRALFPLAIEVTKRLSHAFNGSLRVSYSGGADARNIGKLVDAGVWPVTLATTLLKPGGYRRMHQIAGILESDGCKPFCDVDCDKLQAIADGVISDPMYRKHAGRRPERKIKAAVPLIDCFIAPCREGCPIGQDIPAYLRLEDGDAHLEALRVITERNPLPHITGAICPQYCADKCTRGFYEGAVCIRAAKQEAAAKAFDALLDEIRSSPKSGGRIAVIGGGPAGLVAAYFLARAGRPVTIFEKREAPGGIVRYVIPGFRIGCDAIDKDIELIKAMGPDLRLSSEIKSLDDLRAEGFEQIVVAVGAWKPVTLELAGSDGGAPLDAISFLERLKQGPLPNEEPAKAPFLCGENVVVVGGGNTAMDAARAAKRLDGVRNVTLVYRRTKQYMPADAEELELALEDGVVFLELLAPVGLNNAVLTCERMELGEPDASGRRYPVPTGKTLDIPADTVISAAGSHVDTGLLTAFGVPTDARGSAIYNEETLEAGIPGVYVIGDAKRGPATVVQAIADAMRCAEAITGAVARRFEHLNVNPNPEHIRDKKSVLYCGRPSDRGRDLCLECATICECCVDVCPNRANISIPVGGRPQIVHVDFMCNECGNCETFCPYESAPYKDKLTLYMSTNDFKAGENPGFVSLGNGTVRVRLDGITADHRDGRQLPEGIWTLICTALSTLNAQHSTLKQ